MERSKEYNTSVIVGRFQVDELTPGHIELIKGVKGKHKRNIIVIGLSAGMCTFRNPLDFKSRMNMINDEFPDIEIMYIKDVGSDVLWSDTLDAMLKKAKCTPDDTCLYGSRDSFIQYYSGKFNTYELEQTVFTSGTARRKELASTVVKSTDFRRGVIWAVNNQYPKALSTVDIAIFNQDYTKILLGRKEQEGKYRFVGGFVMPGQTHEETAVRETQEETHLVVKKADLKYQGSFVIDDWRYRGENDKITTILYATNVWEGTPAPDDDIYELRWFPFNRYTIDSVMEEHREMFTSLLTLG